MKISDLFILLISITLATSCSDNSLEGTYSFSQLSLDREYYGFVKVDGIVTAISSDDIDPSIFDEANSASPINNITFIDSENLTYDANSIYMANTEIRNEQSTYQFENDQLTLTFKDEFGNEDEYIFKLIEEQLELTMIATRVVRDGDLQPIEKNYETPNFGYSPGNAENMIEAENIEEIYVMYYKQIYKM